MLTNYDLLDITASDGPRDRCQKCAWEFDLISELVSGLRMDLAELHGVLDELMDGYTTIGGFLHEDGFWDAIRTRYTMEDGVVIFKSREDEKASRFIHIT